MNNTKSPVPTETEQEALKKQLVDDGHKLMRYFDAFVIDVICLLGDPQN